MGLGQRKHTRTVESRISDKRRCNSTAEDALRTNHLLLGHWNKCTACSLWFASVLCLNCCSTCAIFQKLFAQHIPQLWRDFFFFFFKKDILFVFLSGPTSFDLFISLSPNCWNLFKPEGENINLILCLCSNIVKWLNSGKKKKSVPLYVIYLCIDIYLHVDSCAVYSQAIYLFHFECHLIQSLWWNKAQQLRPR